MIHNDNSVALQPLIQQIFADVHGVNFCRPPLQQTIGESSRTRSDIGKNLSLRIIRKIRKGLIQLIPAVGNETFGFCNFNATVFVDFRGSFRFFSVHKNQSLPDRLRSFCTGRKFSVRAQK